MNISRLDPSYANLVLPYRIRFCLLLIFNIPSIICSFLLLYILFTDRTIRRSLHNHFVCIILLINLVSQLFDIPIYLSYLWNECLWPATPWMCIFWILSSYQSYFANTIIVASASIQRHILVFRRQWLATPMRRFLIHYLPMIIILSYCTAYGFVIAPLILSDGHKFDYSSPLCGGLLVWVSKYYGLFLWDLIFNDLLPTPIVVISSLILIYRVAKQKRLVGKGMTWRKQRILTLQLVSVSALFCLINLPPILLYAIRSIHDYYMPYGIEVQIYFSFFTYFQCILLPFVCLNSLFNRTKRLIETILNNLESMVIRFDRRTRIGVVNTC